MKKSFFIFSSITLTTLLVMACQSPVETIDIEKEKQEIKAVNEEERDAFFAQDISRLEAIWMHESTSQRYFCSGKSLTLLNGWTEITDNYGSSIKPDMWADYEDLMADFSNYNISVYGKTAIVSHDVKWSGKHLGEPYEAEQKRVCHLVKAEDGWKFTLIIMMTVPVEE